MFLNSRECRSHREVLAQILPEICICHIFTNSAFSQENYTIAYYQQNILPRKLKGTVLCCVMAVSVFS